MIELVNEGDGTFIRTSNGVRTGGPVGRYHRLISTGRWQPPFVVSGRIRVHARMPHPVWIISEQRWQPDTWQHGITVHPVYVSNADNWNVVTLPREIRDTVSVFTELNNDGVMTWSVHDGGFRRNGPAPNFYDGRWHTFKVDVPEHGRFSMRVDDVEVAAGLEGKPSFSGAQRVGFRVDFHDVELADVTVRREGSRCMSPDPDPEVASEAPGTARPGPEVPTFADDWPDAYLDFIPTDCGGRA